MSYVVLGATGQLGSLVIEALLQQGIPADLILATGRNVTKLDAWHERGVSTRQVDLAAPDGPQGALHRGDHVLLISTTTPGERFENHRRVIDEAAAAHVDLLVYTSTINAGSAQMILADEHRRTEQHLRASGVPFVILRNGWYLENYVAQLASVRATGALIGAARDGVVSAASRRDLAVAAARAMVDPTLQGRTLELGGEGLTLEQIAALMGSALNTTITYLDLDPGEYADRLEAAGIPHSFASAIADADSGLARGELATTSDHLSELLGRRPLTAHQLLEEAATDL